LTPSFLSLSIFTLNGTWVTHRKEKNHVCVQIIGSSLLHDFISPVFVLKDYTNHTLLVGVEAFRSHIGVKHAQMTFISLMAQLLLAIFIVVSVSVLLLIVVYKYNSRFERWMNQAFLFPAAAAQRRGVWAKDPRYWEFVSPKDKVGPRGCDSCGRPPFDAQQLTTTVGHHHHRGSHRSHGLHRRSEGRSDDVPLLIPA
jgi:hypothetical protein